MNAFQYNNYREALRELLLAKKAKYGNRYTFAKLATACRVRHTYLSTVLGGEGHLSADQVFDAAQFLELGEEEYQYVSLLHECERSISPARRARLEQQIGAAWRQGLKTDAYVGATPMPEIDQQASMDFYLNINASLVHMFLTIPFYRSNLDKIRKTLGLEIAVFTEALQICERAGLIRIRGKKVELLRDSIHLPDASAVSAAYRTMLRQKSIEFMLNKERDRHYSFGVIYSAREETRKKIQARFLEFVSWVQKETQEGEPTDVYQLNFDLLRWSET